MLGIPATVAGCKEIIFSTPPRKDGTICPEVLYVAAKVFFFSNNKQIINKFKIIYNKVGSQKNCCFWRSTSNFCNGLWN